MATRPVGLRAAPGRLVRRAAVLSLAVVLLIVLGAVAAAAAPPPQAVVTGEPTVDETDTIVALWHDFTTLFAAQRECLLPVEVNVVARAEDWYGGRDVGPIAAFYRVPPDAVVFVEHDKVTAGNLIHEFAHHLDLSCGVGESRLGRAFLIAQGFDPGAPWMYGPSWARVPAEAFAEAVVAAFGISPSLPLRTEAMAAMWGLARIPVRLGDVPPLPLGRADPAELARVLVTATGVLAAL